MRRVHGPYRHHDRWRIKIVERRTGMVTHQSFSTEDEARAALRSLRRALALESGIKVSDALDAYEQHLAVKGNKPRTVLTPMYRLRRFFGSVRKLAVIGLTPTAGQKRQTVLRHVRRICNAVGVPTVSPHGLRGTHASLAMTAGATGDLVAAALGHESFTTTERYYARPEAVAAAQQLGALRELEKSSRPFPRAA